MKTLGIDPGLTGGIVLLDSVLFQYCIPMQHELKASGKKRLDVSALVRATRALLVQVSRDDPVHVALEEVGAMPGQGSVSGFGFGESYGAARFFATQVAWETNGTLLLVRPSIWKKEMKLSAEKSHSIAVAQRFFPQAHQVRKHDGIAEAALLALYLYNLRR